MKKNLKILFLSSDRFPPFRVDVRVLLGEKLIERGHSIDWIMQSGEDCKKHYVTKWKQGTAYVGATDNRKSVVNRIRRIILCVTHISKVLYKTRKEAHDAIIVKDLFITAVISLMIRRKSKPKYFYWLSYPFPEASIYGAKTGLTHYPYFYLLRGFLLKILLYRSIIPSVDHVFVQSQQMKKDLILCGAPDKKLEPIPMGVKLSDIPIIRIPESNINPSPISTLAYLGAVQRERKIDFILYILRDLLEKGINAQLMIVGGGKNSDDDEFLHGEANRLNVLDRITITGFLQQRDAWVKLIASDVCISPFFPTPILNSTSPTKLIEYMALEKPVVANDHPEQKKILEESNGGICVPYSVDAFSSAIREILANPSMGKMMGRNGRMYVEKNRDYTIIAKKVEKSLKYICS